MDTVDARGLTADDHRESAKASRQRSIDSFERSDTDGFLSQWAADLTANEHLAQADIIDAGNTHEFWGLFEGDRRVKAKMVQVYNKFAYREEMKWVVEDDDPICKARKWIPTGDASRIQKKLGLRERKEIAPARAGLRDCGGQCQVSVYRTGCEYGFDALVVPDEEDD